MTDPDEEFDARPIIEQLLPVESEVTFDIGVELLTSAAELTDEDRRRWGVPAPAIPTGWDPGVRPDTPRLAAKPKRKGKKKITDAQYPNATHWRTWADEVAGIPPEPIPTERIG